MKTVRIPIIQFWLYRLLLVLCFANAVIDFVRWI